MGPATPIRTSARAGPPSAEANMRTAIAAKQRMTVSSVGMITQPRLIEHAACQTYTTDPAE